MSAFPRRRIRIFPLVAVLVGIGILLSLGIWQLERRAWKHEQLDLLHARMAAPAVPLPANIDDPAAWNYRRVTVTGTYLTGHDMLLTGRPRGGWMGFEVATPLVRADGGGNGNGLPVLVNRGYVPLDWKDPAKRASAPAGTVTVTGIARLPSPRVFMQPDNTPGSDQWSWADLPAMATAAGLPAFAPVIVEVLAVAGTAERYPEPGRPVVDLPDNHLTYALTWFGLAFVLAAIYLISQRFMPREDDFP